MKIALDPPVVRKTAFNDELQHCASASSVFTTQSKGQRRRLSTQERAEACLCGEENSGLYKCTGRAGVAKSGLKGPITELGDVFQSLGGNRPFEANRGKY